MIIRYKEIFNNKSGSEIISIPSNASIMKIEITNGELEIYAQFKKDGDFWSLSGLNNKDYSQSIIVTEPGLYTYEINGVYALKISYTGTGKVSYKLIR